MCVCGGVVTCDRRYRYRKYCSACIAAGLCNSRVIRQPGDARTSQGLRAYLLRTRPHRCEVCGGSEWQGRPMPLEADHIDGNPEHNTDANLRLICPNCHAQTPTFKARNKGNGRHARRVRYAAGKSF